MLARARIVRWLLVVAGAAAAGLAMAVVAALPPALKLLPEIVWRHPVEWSAFAFAVTYFLMQVTFRSRVEERLAAARAHALLDRLDAASALLLDRGLRIALLALVGGLLATWVPHYLTWPWCRDEDTFAALAQWWDSGIRPYRDVRSYNFPGHTYLHWILGRTFGWGRTVPFYALDVSAVIALGVALRTWSLRRLGGSLPGLVGYVAFLSFYLSTHYESVAERDWHATLAAALALMALEAWPGRSGIWIAAALEATALTIRPHAALFLPAMVSAIIERPRRVRTFAEWALALGLSLIVAFAPLLLQGLLDDLIRGLRIAAYGGPYSRATVAGSLGIIREELTNRWTAALLGSLILVWRFGGTMRPLARTWLFALGAAVVYRALHPVQHAYLDHPLALIGSLALALPVAWIVSSSWLPRPLRVLAVLLLLYEVMPQFPSFCLPFDSLRAVGPLARGIEPPEAPPGCRYHWFQFEPKRCAYEWSDYRRTLEYLRQNTRPETQVANLLRRPPFPSLNGPTGRLSPLRAESGICWMWLIDVDLDDEFAQAVEQTPDAVVVWAPDEEGAEPRLKLPHLMSVVRRAYRQEARFGRIEVWRRVID